MILELVRESGPVENSIKKNRDYRNERKRSAEARPVVTNSGNELKRNEDAPGESLLCEDGSLSYSIGPP